MSVNHFRVAAVVIGPLAAAGVLAACSSSGGGAAATTAPAANSPATSSVAGSSPADSSGGSSSASTGSGGSLTATETEFKIALSSETLKAGTYTINVKNAGSLTHALSITGPGIGSKTTGDISPGSSGSVTVTLAAGSYDVFCPVGNHKMLGMDDMVTVS